MDETRMAAKAARNLTGKQDVCEGCKRLATIVYALSMHGSSVTSQNVRQIIEEAGLWNEDDFKNDYKSTWYRLRH